MYFLSNFLNVSFIYTVTPSNVRGSLLIVGKYLVKMMEMVENVQNGRNGKKMVENDENVYNGITVL